MELLTFLQKDEFMNRTIVYLMSGPAHAPYLATSLWTLRQHWQGNVQVYAWPESYDMISRITSDSRINAGIHRREPMHRGKNAQFLDKILLMQQVESPSNLYLDADTLIAGPLDEMFMAAEEKGFVATQFSDWFSAGGLARRRIERLKNYSEIDGNLVDMVISEDLPSVNGGVFACRPESPVLPLWLKWSWAARGIFICDECVLHLMQTAFSGDEITVSLGGKYNASPKYVPEIGPDKVSIWHGHGDCWTRPEKSRYGWSMWWRVFRECLDENVGEMQDWYRQTNNKHLNELLKPGASP